MKGIDCVGVDVEVDISQGLPSFSIVGLGDTSVQEAKQRVRAAIKNSGCKFPMTRKTVNLAPANVKKQGPSFDLPVALALLVASGQINESYAENVLYVGELALNGDVKPINGVLLMVMYAKEMGYKKIVVPEGNLVEAGLISGIEVCGVRRLRDVWSGELIYARNSRKTGRTYSRAKIDMSSILGHENVKRALMLAAGGRHNVLMTGPPGSGKTSLACAFQGILPEMDIQESLEVSKIYSVMGLLPAKNPLIQARPFRSVHHSASRVSLIGGGQNALPGEISLAHNGVLFLDEVAEFPARILNDLRQPLEDGVINISRSSGRHSYPAKFVFLAAMNPCPCGFNGDPIKKCICSRYQIEQYQSKLSGPLLDRIDIFIDLPRLDFQVLDSSEETESSSELKKKVEEVRKIQRERFAEKKKFNGDMNNEDIKVFCRLKDSVKEILKKAQDVLNLSPRGYFRTLKLARTIADFNGLENIDEQSLKEALQYRLCTN